MDKINLEFVEDLLTKPTLKERITRLEAAGLFDAEGLYRLIDTAAELAVSDPGKARRLAALCAAVADAAAAPAVVPPATYTQARTHAINGEFDVALRLIRSAHDGYVSLGENLEALRTNVGLMAVLLELGRYGEALDAGQVVLDALGDPSKPYTTSAPQESDFLTAMVDQNRGRCYEYMGRYDEALRVYASAEERYRALGMIERLGEITSNRGAILLHLGRGSEALAAHEAAATLFEEAGLALSHAQALGNIGETHLRLGNYQQSLDAFQQARHLLEPLDAYVEECFLLRNTADAYLALNLYPEALATYQEADDMLRTAGMVYDRGQALWGMGSTLIARSEFAEAERALAEAAALFASADNEPLLSGVMLELATLLTARGEHEEALVTAGRALTLVSEKDWPVHLVYAHMRMADLLLPDVAKSEPHLLAAKRLVEHLALPHLRYRLDERLGHLRRLQGRLKEARKLLEAAVDEIERLRGTLAQEAVRASFLRDKITAYEDLLQLHLGQGDDESLRCAFAVAERAKSRTLVDLLVGVINKDLSTPVNSELETRLQDLQADLNAIYDRLLAGASEHGAPLSELRRKAVEIEREISRVRLQAAPAKSTPSAVPAPLDSVHERLSDNVILVAYHVVGDEIMAFVNVGGDIQVVRRLGSVTVVQRLLQRLTAQWERFRAGSQFVSRHIDMLERSARHVLASLYTELVAPLEALLSTAPRPPSGEAGATQKLAIVPHGLLHQVPFHALFDREHYLIDRFEISYAPSARVYSLCQEQAPRNSGKALVLSVPDPLIPAVTHETHAIVRYLRGAEVRDDTQATMAMLRAEAPGCDILHLACHGMFRADNPMYSALKLYDGWLRATDVLQLDLTGALVTLSACESGRNQIITGDEILGLSRAFLGAGAVTLVVSLWLVQDETTVWLMEKWYEQLVNGMERAAALRAAQLALKAVYPHPYYWAPFVLIGRR